MKRHFSYLAVALLVLSGTASAQGLLTRFDKGAVTIVTVDGRHDFAVELALTPEQRQQGLMFRREMAPDAGMLFDFGAQNRRASMWMKNTYIPLDMLFVKADGEIESIAERTTPQSLEAISSRGPVRYVLELNGGTAARTGIVAGDRLEIRAGN